MTEAQNAAVAKIKDIMREHFEAGVLIVNADDDTDDGDETRVAYHGGFVMAMGLVNQARNKLDIEDMNRWCESEELERDE